jgi:hypothetical protein
LGTVSKLEKAGKHPSVFLRIWKDGFLEIDPMRQEVIIFIQPSQERGKKDVDGTAAGRLTSVKVIGQGLFFQFQDVCPGSHDGVPAASTSSCFSASPCRLSKE